ncbi:FAD binding domain-containing protein [Streptomyces sp. 4N509B]|uniref:FAD binding domain-containing protein n=1 Tax=Streptomyces sp. 4N509B TaxID=3457413 RepID=UPI003FD014C4
MKPPPLRYLRPRALPEALRELHAAAPGARLLAGGQSLVARLNLRQARPTLLVDVAGLAWPDGPGPSDASAPFTASDASDGLRRVALVRGERADAPVELRVGALVTHDQVTRHPGPLPGFEDVRAATRFIAHLPVRVRGTVGGSLANADPVAEWWVTALLHDAELVLASVRGLRVLPAADVLTGRGVTAIAPDEMLLQARLRTPLAHAELTECARRPGDPAIVSAAAGFDLVDGVLRRPRVVVAGAGPTPTRLPAAEAVLAGAEPGPRLFAHAAEAAAAVLSPSGDRAGSAAYRRHLATVLVARALTAAWRRPDRP